MKACNRACSSFTLSEYSRFILCSFFTYCFFDYGGTIHYLRELFQEILQQRRRATFVQAAIGCWPVRTSRLIEDARAELDAAALQIIGAEIETAKARKGDRRRAHRTG